MYTKINIPLKNKITVYSTAATNISRLIQNMWTGGETAYLTCKSEVDW
jgi:hypothetical protein